MRINYNNYKLAKSGSYDEICVCCPFCETKGKTPDTKYKLYIHLKKKIYHCFRCESHGSLSKSQEFIENFVNNKETPDLSKLKNRLTNFGNKKEESNFDLECISNPLNLEVSPIAYGYIKEVRKFSDEDIIKYKLRVGKPYLDKKDGKEFVNNKWKGRILFPFIENNKVVFIVGRTYTDLEPKYRNSEGTKDSVVYGLDNVKGECILCEGIISAIAAEKIIGIPAISCLGKHPTDMQLEKIRTRCDKIYLSLDSDVEKQVKMKTITRLITLGFNVWNVLLPLVEENGKKLCDPDDLGYCYKEYFDKAKKINIFGE